MSKPDRSIDPRLLESASQEFLLHGFRPASLQRICKSAGVTTGALYKRFRGKEDLFGALVRDIVEDLNGLNEAKARLLESNVSDAVLVKCWDMNYNSMMAWFTFLDQRREAFTLLMRCAEGTAYEKFEHDYCEQMTELNYGFYTLAFERGIAREVITKKDMHIADSAYWKAICEPFIHGYSFEEIQTINRHICHFFNYYALIGVDPDKIREYQDYDFNAELESLLAPRTGGLMNHE